MGELLPALERGARVISAEWFRPYFADIADGITDGKELLFLSDFLSEEFQKAVEPFLGDAAEWSVSFGKYVLKMREEDGFTYEIAESY